MLTDVLLVIAGSTALLFAADRLVSNTADLAARLRVSPVVVGAIVIGFGTSIPEMLVSLAALDQPNGLDLAIGNVVGSNIANVALVLGLSVLFFPFSGPSRVIKREGLLMLGALVLVSVFLWDQSLQAWEGAALVASLFGAGFMMVKWSKAEQTRLPDQRGSAASLSRLGAYAVISLVALAIGARVLVLGAESLAIEFGLSESLVGLTILALGTSLPELGTVLASARRGQNDLVLGNVVGSNLFNSLGVAGVTGIVGAGSLAFDFRANLIVMVAIAMFAGVAALSGDRYHRVEGALLLSAYPAAIWMAL
jgi:cation:H+ antiporter